MSSERIRAITIQADEVWVVRRRPSSVEVRCGECQATMVTPEEAAVLFAVSVREIYRVLEAGWLHFQELPGGAVLICFESMRKLRESSQPIKNEKEIES